MSWSNKIQNLWQLGTTKPLRPVLRPRACLGWSLHSRFLLTAPLARLSSITAAWRRRELVDEALDISGLRALRREYGLLEDEVRRVQDHPSLRDNPGVWGAPIREALTTHNRLERAFDRYMRTAGEMRDCVAG